MNLKSKLQHRLTAVVQMLSPVSCIFSDEVSPTHLKALQLMNADTPDALKDMIRTHAIKTAAQTKFPPRIAIIHENDSVTIHPVVVESTPETNF